MRQLVLAALIVCLIGVCPIGAFSIGPAAAQAPVSQAQPQATAAQIDRVVGPWELSNPAGDRKCDVTFKPERTGPGFGLGFGASCAGTFPAVAAAAAWTVTPNGNIQWLDRTGAATFDFGETEVGIFEALRPGDPSVYFLTNRGLAGTALPTADEIAGIWTLGQPRGRALCTLTFKPELAAMAGPLEQRFALDVAEGCERSVAALGLTSWRLERELLVIQGGTTVLSFKRDPDGRWTKVPADNRPLVMSRE